MKEINKLSFAIVQMLMLIVVTRYSWKKKVKKQGSVHYTNDELIAEEINYNRSSYRESLNKSSVLENNDRFASSIGKKNEADFS